MIDIVQPGEYEATALRDEEFDDFCSLSIQEPTVWLSPYERRHLSCFADARYRRQFAVCRLLAKLLIRRLGLWNGNLCAVTIISRHEEGQRTAPTAWTADGALPLLLSLSHLHGISMAAVRGLRDKEGETIGMTVPPGVDLVQIGSVTGTLVRQYFTESERCRCAAIPSERPEIFWAAKEAFYKSMLNSEPFVPKHIETENIRMEKDGTRTLTTTGNRRNGSDKVSATVRVWCQDGYVAALCGAQNAVRR